jgi:hypothetical protein
VSGAPRNLHATAIVYDGIGVLITGPSGAGKSLLALDLLDHAQLAGRVAHLIADDQVLVEADEGRLFAAAPPTIAGRIELRFRGIVLRPHAGPAAIALLAEFTEEADRHPELHAFSAQISGITLMRAPIPLAASPVHRRLLALEAIETLRLLPKNTT